MHNLHFIVVRSSSGEEACKQAENEIIDFGTDNNWRTMCGAVSQDNEVYDAGDGRYRPAETDYTTIEAINDPRVLTYTDVVLHKKPVGKKVAIIGAGGIGFDVAEFLTNEESNTIPTFMQEWGVDMNYTERGALQKNHATKSPREVYLLQRSKGKLGGGLGKTTGWIHRAALKMKKVKMIAEVSYEKIDAEGFHIKVAGASQVLDVDNIVICAGQVSNNQLYHSIK
jgi:2,4-dienoyl-CoA reductase (NADPH2)